MATKNKKGLKKSKKETVFPENQVMTMLESMNDGISILAENQTGLRDELKEFKKETRNNFKKADEKLEDFKQETRNNFSEVFDRLDEITSELKEIKRDIKRLDKNKIDKFEYNDLLKRVVKLEREVKKQKMEKIKCT